MGNETTMVDYYARRAAEYEEVYREPERQPNLMRLAEIIASAFPGLDVLEVACGTAYWTQYIAKSARRIVASDASAEVLEIARLKACGSCDVSFLQSDAYALGDAPTDCTAGFHGFWDTHKGAHTRDSEIVSDSPGEDEGSFLLLPGGSHRFNYKGQRTGSGASALKWKCGTGSGTLAASGTRPT
jgi:SAM-dependent methyltransferase